MVNSFETAKEKLTAYLTETKKSKTIARYNVLKAIYEQKSCFTAEELYQQINANSKDRVCFATVYNTLLILQDCKLIVKYRLDNAVSQYYEVASETEYHHFIVCSECGAMRKFIDVRLQNTIRSKTFKGFKAQKHTLTIYGLCTACSRKKKKKG